MVIFTVDLYLHLVKFVSLFYFGQKRSHGQDRDLYSSLDVLQAVTHDVRKLRTAYFNLLFNKGFRYFI